MTEMKNSFEGLTSRYNTTKTESLRLNTGELKLHKLKCEDKKQFFLETELNLQELQDNIKMCSVYIFEIPKEKKEYREEEIFEIITVKNFPKIMTDTKLQMQSSENTKHDKYQQNNIQEHPIATQKTKDKYE